jgi:iron-sulfur cluster repair protein YtfE (RIC family)
MSTSDPLHDLAHDHAELNRRVLEAGALVTELARAPHAGRTRELASLLGQLCDLLFAHFAREEEALFPFVVAAIPKLAKQVDEMAVAHDGICGALARMTHLASSTATAEHATITALFGRFETAYVNHAHAEAALLRSLEQQLAPAQRAELAELVRGL